MSLPASRRSHRWARSLPTLASLLFLTASLGVASCGGDRYDVAVRLDSGPTADPPVAAVPDPSTGEPIRFVYASVLSPERSVLTYARLGRFLSRELNREVTIVRRRTYAELNELLRTGQAEAGLVCTGAFAAGEDGFGLEAIAIPVIEGRRTYRSYVITRRNSGLSDFQSLRGTTFAFTDPLSNTGYRYVAARLLDSGTTPDRFFGEVVFTYGHDNSIEAVRDGLVDAGSIDSLVWDELLRRDPSLGEDVVVIDRSEDFPINPVAASPSLGQELKVAIRNVFLAMNDDQEGRAILYELGTDEFVVPSRETHDGYDAIARSWRRLQAAGNSDDGS